MLASRDNLIRKKEYHCHTVAKFLIAPETRQDGSATLQQMASEVQGTPTMEATSKPIHTIILDAGPIIKGEPAVSTLLSQCEQLLTTTSVIEEIKDKATRTRLETILMPFLVMRSPKLPSIKFVSEFARKTGDFSVLSRTDIELLALAYELECERNGGDWRLRKSPGQRRTNGPLPFKAVEPNPPEEQSTQDILREWLTQDASTDTSHKDTSELEARSEEATQTKNSPPNPGSQEESSAGQKSQDNVIPSPNTEEDAPLEASLRDLDLDPTFTTDLETEQGQEQDSDSDGWITPANINRKQLEGASSNSSKAVEPKTMQVVCFPWLRSFIFPHNSRLQ